MTARGIKKPGTLTRTASLRGAFKDDFNLRTEFYSLIGD
jgi:GTP cyclohydrolase I